jgi:tRNA (Thr-GGU) A37 N-methylase
MAGSVMVEAMEEGVEDMAEEVEAMVVASRDPTSGEDIQVLTATKKSTIGVFTCRERQRKIKKGVVII